MKIKSTNVKLWPKESSLDLVRAGPTQEHLRVHQRLRRAPLLRKMRRILPTLFSIRKKISIRKTFLFE